MPGRAVHRCSEQINNSNCNKKNTLIQTILKMLGIFYHYKNSTNQDYKN